MIMNNWKFELWFLFDCIKLLIKEREWWWYFPFERCEWCGRWNYELRTNCWRCSWKIGDKIHD